MFTLCEKILLLKENMTSAVNLRKILIIFTFLTCISKVVCKTHLTVTNNGPAIIGANITFNVLLSDYSPQSSLTYIFNDGVKSVKLESKRSNVSISLEFPPELYTDGRYSMNVTVEVPFFIVEKKLAFNYSYFELRRSLIGEILIYQGNQSYNEDVKEIAVGENFTAIASLYDPNHYLKDAIIDYTWSFDMDQYFTLNNSFTYNFSDVGDKVIIVKPKAVLPNSLTVSGFFYKNLKAEVPVNHVNVSGNFFLHHGDFLKLNISCLGTPPFTYCYEIFKGNVTVNNFTCHQISLFTSCHFFIQKLLTDGTYQLGIFIGNDITEVRRVIQIKVFPVTIKPALSTIIIPISCSLLTLIIIAIGVSFYIKQRNQLVIEIADFDFQDESDSFIGERTFFEKIIDSVACRNCGRNRFSCVKTRSESDPLLDDDSYNGDSGNESLPTI